MRRWSQFVWARSFSERAELASWVVMLSLIKLTQSVFVSNMADSKRLQSSSYLNVGFELRIRKPGKFSMGKEGDLVGIHIHCHDHCLTFLAMLIHTDQQSFIA